MTPQYLAAQDMPPPQSPGIAAHRIEGVPLDTPVLVVEDEAMIACMIETLLEDMGFSAIAVVATGEDAVRDAVRLRAGLVISDINLGQTGIDGIAAAAAIRAEMETAVIFVTGYAGQEARERISRHVPGAHLLRKPLAIEELRRAIVAAVGDGTAN